MPAQARVTQPLRKSARVENARSKPGNTRSQGVDNTSQAGRSRKKQKVAGTPSQRRRRRAIDDEVKELPSRVSRGSLSRLLDISLDVLLEIFTHVMPGDLLKLACVNKSFSELLLSRRSLSMWRASLDSASIKGYPPKPDDWTELAWVQLVSGSKLCSLCDGMTTLDILWTFRVRLCASCRDAHIYYIDSNFVGHKLRNTDRDIRTIIPSCTVESRWGRPSTYVFSEDVLAYHNQLEELSHEYPNETLFLVKRDELDAEMMEDTRLVLAHAKLCEEGYERFKEELVADKEAQTKQRVAQIYDRLRGIGFETVDLEEPLIRQHKDVNNPRPLTKEAWERLKPGFIELAKLAKKTRLEREKGERRQAREKGLAIEYRAFLKDIASETVSLMPTMSELIQFPQISDAIADDQGATDALHKTVAQALVASLPSVSETITTRAKLFKKAIPHDWPVALLDQDTLATSASSESASQRQLDLHASVAGLDLVAYTFSCIRPSRADNPNSCEYRVYFGLDALAHSCRSSDWTTFKFKPLSACHQAVLRVLKSLQLDPASTSVLLLDKLDPAFVDSSSLTGWSQNKTYKLINWRQAVEHVRHSIARAKASSIRMLTQSERRWFEAEVVNKGGRLSRIASEHPGLNQSLDIRFYQAIWRTYTELCASKPDDPWRWFTLPQIRVHLTESHAIATPRDGLDYFMNRRIGRSIQTNFPLIPANLSVGEKTKKV